MKVNYIGKVEASIVTLNNGRAQVPDDRVNLQREFLAEKIPKAPTHRYDFVYAHCSTTEDEIEEEQSSGYKITRPRTWLCCPLAASADQTVAIKVADNSENNVSSTLRKANLLEKKKKKIKSPKHMQRFQLFHSRLFTK